MQLIITFFAAYLVAYSNQSPMWGTEIDATVKKCATQTGYDIARLEKMKDPLGENTPEFRCLVKCALMEYGQMDANGVISSDEILKMYEVEKDDAEGKEVVTKCVAEHVEADLCERAYQVRTCISKVFDFE